VLGNSNKLFRMMVARDGVERFSAPCNQQVADYTMDTKDKEDSKDICCVRFVCGFSSIMLRCGACKNCCGPKTRLGKNRGKKVAVITTQRRMSARAIARIRLAQKHLGQDGAGIKRALNSRTWRKEAEPGQTLVSSPLSGLRKVIGQCSPCTVVHFDAQSGLVVRADRTHPLQIG
jgi:hypothetical protein